MVGDKKRELGFLFRGNGVGRRFLFSGKGRECRFLVRREGMERRFLFRNKKGESRFLPKSKKGMEIEELGKWLIGVAILVILMGGAIYLKSKGIDILDYIKDLFRFGRR